MKRILLIIAATAVVFTTTASSYADQTVDCTVQTRANWVQCVIQNSQSGKEG